ncbi:OmpA family protein [Granulosicoccus antarcticus]|uniref:Outer membrane porin F n=1 Tax=Granulosicoccus antarcticus IMCC3135 TaxID=1192854 RepID=A0A2Z2P4F5_9GAMM|nr:OmpA family protein [Granulosicoccus antarcticus]ASJ75557.1 Outer membrane porin F [Granulosicoccus antarcticus IMCC3135]
MNFPRNSRRLNAAPGRYRSILAVLIGSVLTGCVMPSGQPSLQLPSGSSDFRSRLYAGASLGGSHLSSSEALEVESSNAMTTQLRLGYDLHDRVAVELDTSILGESQLRESQSAVDHTSASVSALIYGLSGSQMRSRREGLSAYARLGYGSLKRSSDIVELENSESGPVLGLGAEYGLSNGLGLRADITRFDADVSYIGLGAVYRFGVQASSRGQMVAGAAEPSLGAANTAGPEIEAMALSMADRWRPAMRRGDADADGVLDSRDDCPETIAHITVDNTGCGLFDAVLSDVRFRSGSSWLSPSARAQLNEVAETLLAFPESRVQVRAHTDSQGKSDMNMNLSTGRAQVVSQYLQSRGVHERQLQAVGMGETEPLGSNSTAVGRLQNRRVDVVTLPDQDAGQLSVQPMLAVRRVIVVSDPRQRDSQRDGLVDTQDVVSASPTREKSSLKTAEAKAVVSEEPDLQSAMSVDTTARSRIPIMPLPEPGFAPGVSISGVVDGLDFPDGSSELSANARNSLGSVIATMRNNPRIRIAVMAHTDNSGDAQINLRLSKQRAQAVASFLAGEGVVPDRLEAEGYGELLPLVQNMTPADRATNRRVEIRILRNP